MVQNNTPGAQALQKIKNQFPDYWQQLINKAMQKIKTARKELQLENTPADNHEAVLHCMKLGDGLNTANCLLAAEYLINREAELESKHIALEIRLLRLEFQLKKLKRMPWKKQDKDNLKYYYRRYVIKVKSMVDAMLTEKLEIAQSLGIKQPDEIYNLPIVHRNHGRNGLATA